MPWRRRSSTGKVLLVWEEIPESTKLYAFEEGSEAAKLAIVSAGKFINSDDVNPGDPIDKLNDMLENFTPHSIGCGKEKFMHISNALDFAIEEIEQTLKDRPDIYKPFKSHIIAVIEAMKALNVELDHAFTAADPS